MLLKHSLDFVPAHRAGGWSIQDDDQPRLWWRARLDRNSRLMLADGADAHEREVNVDLTVGEVPGDPDPEVPKKGLLVTQDDGALALYLAVPERVFDRILQAVQRREPPTVIVGFGKQDRFKRLTAGPITNIGDDPLHYRWNNDEESQVVAIEGYEFRFYREPEDAPEPMVPEKIPASLRAIGVAWGIVVNLLAVLIAIAVFNAASGKFETAVVSLLLLVYIYLSSWNKVLTQVLGKLEQGEVARFVTLRTLLGMPPSDAEHKYIAHVREKSEKPGYRFWIDSIGSSIIGLLVLYRLFALLFS